MRTLLSWLIGGACALLVLVLVLELGLRLLPVNEGCRTRPVNADNPILTCQPDRTFAWSRFPDFAMTNTVHANNLGFINDQDYTDQGPPLVAVLGDSLVEALMVPYPATGQGRLAKALDKRARVYSFAASGAQLAQYLAYAAYARDRFHPARMVVVVASGDFLESLDRTPGLHSFVEDGRGGLALERADFEPGWLRTLLRRSRLALYLLLNLRLDQLLNMDMRAMEQPGEQAVSPARDTGMADAQRVADAFLAALPGAAGLPRKDILLVFDAQRPIPLTREQAEIAAGTLDARMRDYALNTARQAGFRTVDMTEMFLRDWQENEIPLEFPADTHWTPQAHGRFARAVLDSGLLNGL